MDTVVDSSDKVEPLAKISTATQYQASQELRISSTTTTDDFHWCTDMDYQMSRDNLRSQHSPNSEHSNEISFTSNSDRHSPPLANGRLMNKHFDIHLAQIDIETFKSEDFQRFQQNSTLGPLQDSSDTLRIVDSLTSSNLKSLPIVNEDLQSLSVDSLDLSMCNEINSQLIQKCTESDKTRYKIAMIDTSAHSQMQNSATMTNSDLEFFQKLHHHHQQRSRNDRSTNPFVSAPTSVPLFEGKNETTFRTSDSIQSPGSLVQMFIQNKIHSNDSSTSEVNGYENTLTKCDKFNLFQNRSYSQNDDSQVAARIENSLSTVDSSELPLHVLDLSKKLRSMNLSKQYGGGGKYNSTSMSSNTSYTSTTSTSSATTSDRHRRHQQYNCNNPFMNEESRKTRTTATQFPEIFQDKGIQASFDDEEIKDAPVLVYYPNYSLPDLSFLEDILKEERSNQQIYLSPIKHEPPKLQVAPNPVTKRVQKNSSCPTQRKCRPKSYTDYEMLLNQDFSHIKDWDSLNLLLPDDFKEFLEKNNLINTNNIANGSYSSVQAGNPFPVKTTIGSGHHHRIRSVKMRPHQPRQPQSKRYSLQENNFDVNTYPYVNYTPEVEPINSCMIRSQTMPNCHQAYNGHHVPLPPPLPPVSCYPAPYRNTCCHACCHSSCHSPSQITSPSQRSSNFNWDLLSSNSSFKKLLTFLNKLDECSSHSDSSKCDSQIDSTSVSHKRQQQQQQLAQQHYPKNFDHEPRSTQAKSSKETLARLDSLKNRDHHHQQQSQVRNRPVSATAKSKATSPPISNRASGTKNGEREKTKIILKRPTSLKGGSGIPVPKRISSKSMIPVSRNTQPNLIGAKSRTKSGHTRF